MAHEFPGYRVVERLSTSTRTVVDRAIRLSDASVVIVKQPADEDIASEALRRAQREFDLLQSTRCTGVIAAIELVRDGGHAALIVEHFGDVLARAIASRRFPIDEVLDIAIQVARHLAAVHAAGIVHRDINPNNIVYDAATRTAKLIDFDIATASSEVAGPAPDGTRIEGTLHYLAPEQTGRLNLPVDSRSDLYALGATLFELLTGQRPFEREGALALVHAHLAEQPRRVDAIAPEVPAVVADVVGKLLAKAPDERYQSAHGLRRDLERCRSELAAPTRFSLARFDRVARLELGDKLYGRAAEVQALTDAFARSAAGAVEAVLIAGFAGIGKSSLVRELYAPIAARRGVFAAGKFSQLHRDVPYSGVVGALDELVAQLHGRTESDGWRIALDHALGDDAPALAALVPALAHVLGPPRSAVDPIADAEVARARLERAMLRVLQVFAHPAHPLVLFLDDVQWADVASSRLLHELAASDDTRSLLIVATYRPTEVEDGHPLAALLHAERRDARLTRLALAPLTRAETTDLVADALHLRPGAADAAAAVIWRKTEGNPFFIRQFLRLLFDEGRLGHDPATGGFVLDPAAIEEAAITDNVAELLARQLAKLGPATRDALTTGAALGTTFAVATVAAVRRLAPAAVEAALAPAVAMGAIVALGDDRYRFGHDHLLRAAYDDASPDARVQLHHAIGEHLCAVGGDLFDTVHHLRLGVALLADEPARAAFVDLAREAARRARRSGALDVAATLLRAAADTRDPVAHHAGWLAVQLELAKVVALGGQPDAARAILHAAEAHARDRDLAQLVALDSAICTGVGRMPEALARGRIAAALYGVALPADRVEVERETPRAIGAIMEVLARRPVEALLALPVMTDPHQLATIGALNHTLAAAYQAEPPLMALIAAKIVDLSLRHGNCADSAMGYSCLGIALWVAGQHDLAFRFGRLAVDLTRKLGGSIPAVDFSFALFTAPWREPIEHSIERLRATVTRGLEAGDINHAGFSAMFAISYRHLRGEPLDDVLAEARRFGKLCQRLGLASLASSLARYCAHVRWWSGAPGEPGEDAADGPAAEEARVAGRSRSGLAMFRVLDIERRFWSGDAEGVLEMARETLPLMRSLAGHAYHVELRFYAALAAIELGATAEDPELAGWLAELARCASGCPANFAHHAQLVTAELAQRRGDVGAALASYDAAIASAAEHGWVKVEILAHQHAARFWLAQGKPAYGAIHLSRARDLCEHWGALPRARELELERRRLGAGAESSARIKSSSSVTNTLDFATVLKASHAIATDVVLDSLLAKMMEIIIENTGAQSGLIALDTNGVLSCRASQLAGAPVQVSAGVPLAQVASAPEGIVKYVMRTADSVLLGDATRHPTFRADPYVRARRPRSVLCLPIAHQDRVLGAVYLENNLIVDAFTVDRLDALGILVSQLAISIENALMFAQLEQRVAERTRELTEANRQLREQAAIRERMEIELRLAQKLQSVGQLATGIAHEINTPMQFIGNNVAFLRDAVTTLLEGHDVFRAALGTPADPEVAARIARVDRDLDIDYLRENAPDACERALEGVARVSRIVNAMRAFSHPDRREQSPTVLAVALENTLIVAHNEYGAFADVWVEHGAIPEVTCHPGELSQVLLNLVTNAAHAIEDVVGRTGARGTISISTRLIDDDTVEIAIADTGAGIAEGIRDRVFDPFFTTKQVGRGSGQGLALARTAVIDRHGGALWFETEVGAGTTFFVRLPVRGSGPGRSLEA